MPEPAFLCTQCKSTSTNHKSGICGICRSKPCSRCGVIIAMKQQERQVCARCSKFPSPLVGSRLTLEYGKRLFDKKAEGAL